MTYPHSQNRKRTLKYLKPLLDDLDLAIGSGKPIATLRAKLAALREQADALESDCEIAEIEREYFKSELEKFKTEHAELSTELEERLMRVEAPYEDEDENQRQRIMKKLGLDFKFPP